MPFTKSTRYIFVKNTINQILDNYYKIWSLFNCYNKKQLIKIGTCLDIITERVSLPD